MSLERIVRGRSATLYKTFYASGVAADPTGTPTVTVTRVSDGTAVATGAVTDEAADGTWSVTIPATENLQLDTYTVDWAAIVNTVSQEYLDTVEVAGDVLFTVAEFRALGTPYANTTNYPTASIVAMRTTVEQALEDACSVAFVPRYTRETVNGDGRTGLMLKWAKIRAIRDATVSDVALTAAEIDDLSWTSAGSVYGAGWTAGYGNVTVGYEHGWDRPPERIKRAGLLLAKRWLTPSGVDDRAINVTNESGTYALFQAGVRGHMFDLPEVQAAVDQYSLSVGVA